MELIKLCLINIKRTKKHCSHNSEIRLYIKNHIRHFHVLFKEAVQFINKYVPL